MDVNFKLQENADIILNFRTYTCNSGFLVKI